MTIMLEDEERQLRQKLLEGELRALLEKEPERDQLVSWMMELLRRERQRGFVRALKLTHRGLLSCKDDLLD